MQAITAIAMVLGGFLGVIALLALYGLGHGLRAAVADFKADGVYDPDREDIIRHIVVGLLWAYSFAWWPTPKTTRGVYETILNILQTAWRPVLCGGVVAIVLAAFSMPMVDAQRAAALDLSLYQHLLELMLGFFAIRGVEKVTTARAEAKAARAGVTPPPTGDEDDAGRRNAAIEASQAQQ